MVFHVSRKLKLIVSGFSHLLYSFCIADHSKRLHFRVISHKDSFDNQWNYRKKKRVVSKKSLRRYK